MHAMHPDASTMTFIEPSDWDAMRAALTWTKTSSFRHD
jgi:hypothetical protein